MGSQGNSLESKEAFSPCPPPREHYPLRQAWSLDHPAERPSVSLGPSLTPAVPGQRRPPPPSAARGRAQGTGGALHCVVSDGAVHRKCTGRGGVGRGPRAVLLPGRDGGLARLAPAQAQARLSHYRIGLIARPRCGPASGSNWPPGQAGPAWRACRPCSRSLTSTTTTASRRVVSVAPVWALAWPGRGPGRQRPPRQCSAPTVPRDSVKNYVTA